MAPQTRSSHRRQPQSTSQIQSSRPIIQQGNGRYRSNRIVGQSRLQPSRPILSAFLPPHTSTQSSSATGVQLIRSAEAQVHRLAPHQVLHDLTTGINDVLDGTTKLLHIITQKQEEIDNLKRQQKRLRRSLYHKVNMLVRQEPYRVQDAQQTILKYNLQDNMNYLAWPAPSNTSATMRPVRHCRKCYGTGHNARSCAQK
jgi:hypothetical protein